MSADQVKIALTWNLVFNSKFVENLRKLHLQKLFQIGFPSSTNFPDFFLILYLFLIARKMVFRFIFESGKKTIAWVPPVSGNAATRHAPIG
jgi:uncharacterized membrane protein